ncbi:Hypothetical predicted protein [Olea europaea subsp. europaea]|uniref:Transmembrane protein n=1 Tax=Olea europaea subsp. europaea TaxID=158383 RepID=A0A8S0VB82_OLEEU|nr:Hypothetical predicted protein [Olea europaea subsp. europaea]
MIHRSKFESCDYEVVTALVRASICGMCADLCDLCSGVDIEALRWVVWSDVVVMGMGVVVLACVCAVGGGGVIFRQVFVVLWAWYCGGVIGMVVLIMVVAGGDDAHVGEVTGGRVCDQQLGVCDQLFGRL